MKIGCSFCTQEIPAYAVRYRYCGEWLTTQKYSNAQPVWHFVLLSIFTFGIYEIYCFCRNWRHLKVHKSLDISPLRRTVGLLVVPIYNIVLAYRQLRDIRDFSREEGIDKTYPPGWITFSYFIFVALLFLPYPFGFLCFLSVWPLPVVQGALNSYWQQEPAELMERKDFSGGEITLLWIGGILWILILIGTFIL